jgi:hypothetical protein
MKKIEVKVQVERGSDGRYSAYMDYYDLEFGLSGFGSTVRDAISDFYLSWEEEKKMLAAEGKEIPELGFHFIYDLSSFLDLFAETLSKPGLQKITGINQKQLWHYASGVRKPRPQTVKKIQQGLYDFADSIKQMRFI